ncbi:hypothetical protein DERF_001906 [Dermatophagoides farinae]|uniref:Uncharacterized protein n=1 Tax=Dermatophagoides farinae TaxID=6954 RepID=A0A922L9X1_DERFA|nr:hypothetical protein DERF_001906 [Dermatophagoides farinae]
MAMYKCEDDQAEMPRGFKHLICQFFEVSIFSNHKNWFTKSRRQNILVHQISHQYVYYAAASIHVWGIDFGIVVRDDASIIKSINSNIPIRIKITYIYQSIMDIFEEPNNLVEQ